ncbi:MAG: hypothetical protein EXS31_15235 [Pedosphaera sp.]|nr:hypothetical protein [Pedosphaera sp.]
MKALIVIAIVAAVFYMMRGLFRRYGDAERQSNPSGSRYSNVETPPAPAAPSLEGMPPAYEPALAAAEKQGAAGLRTFLANYGRSIRDPKLAEIELDYVVLLSRQDPIEAKRVFQLVKARVLTTSPVYDRIKKLDTTFQ